MWQVEGQRWPEGLGGLMGMGSDMPAEAPPHWQVYFLVETGRRDRDRRRAPAATSCSGRWRSRLRKLAVFTDPQGAAFALMEPDYPGASLTAASSRSLRRGR